MRLDSSHLDHARKVADAILYEGYLLYPYHRSAQKNQIRFQFGVLMPPAYAGIDDSEPSESQTECLLECPADAEVRMLIRFLQLQRRTVHGISPDTGELHKVDTLYVDGSEFTEWDEAVEREQHATACVADLLGADRIIEFHVGAGESAEALTDSTGRKAGRLVRRWSRAGRDDRHPCRARRRAVPGAAAADRSAEPHHARRAAAGQGRWPAACFHRRALADRRARRHLPVHDGPAGMGRRRSRRLRQHRDLAGAGRPGRLHRSRAVIASYPLRPSGDRRRKRRRSLRCHRDRRDPHAAHARAD